MTWLKLPRLLHLTRLTRPVRVVRGGEVVAGDVIVVGGRVRQVSGVRRIYGSVRLTLDSGELLALARGARYRVTRARSAPQAPTVPADRPPAAPHAPSRRCEPPVPDWLTDPDVHLTIGLTDQGRAEPTRGECWLCDANGVPVIWLGPVQLPAHTAPLMACQPCTQRLHDRATAHARTQDI